MVLDERAVAVGVALAGLALTAVFLVVVTIAGVRRWRGRPLGPGFGHVLAFLGGLLLGSYYILAADDILIVGPLVVAIALLALSAWRRRRRRDAGWLVAGAALPWTALWGLFVVSIDANNFDPGATGRGFLAGLAPLVVGLIIAARGDPPAPPPDPKARPGEPGSRQIGIVGTAIFGAAGIGPFGLQLIAALVAFVASQLVLLLAFVALEFTGPLSFIVSVLVGSVVATEAWIRSMPAPTRQAFEAYSWLGEWEIKQLRELTGEGPPTKPGAALAWLTRHPDRPELRWARVEILSFARQHAEAIRTAESLPDSTPAERFDRASAIELSRWNAGEDPDLDALEAAARALPDDTDERLRADVTVAAAKVRRRMADGRSEPGDASQPLIDVRERLGRRADGQVGRAFRKRLLPIFVGTGFLIGILNVVLDIGFGR